MASAVLAHTTDLSGDDLAAFHHACALAAASGARLVTVHGNGGAEELARLPDARALARTWGRPIDHERMCHEWGDDVAETVLDALRTVAPELVVVGTHGRHGLAALVHGSVAEAIARSLPVPTLFVPNRARGFVDPATGAIELRRVLVPAGTRAEATAGLAAARALLRLAGATGVELAVLHLAPGGADLFTTGDPTVTLVRGDGPVVEAVLREARGDVQLVVMATHGHDGLTDALLGSHTEQVVRDAPCPVLSVPATA